MKKITEEKIIKAIYDLSKRVTELEDAIDLLKSHGQFPMSQEVTFMATQNPDGTFTPAKREREIIIS